jgi:hypothetical protein
LLEAVQLDLRGIGWVICGGKSDAMFVRAGTRDRFKVGGRPDDVAFGLARTI